MSVIDHGDILDVRDLARTWRELLDTDEQDRDEDWREDDAAFRALCSDLGCEGGPDDLQWIGDDYEPTLIRDHYFITYAQELAEDIGAIDRDAKWPNNRIDWEAAADDLRENYMTARLAGEDYLIRQF